MYKHILSECTAKKALDQRVHYVSIAELLVNSNSNFLNPIAVGFELLGMAL